MLLVVFMLLRESGSPSGHGFSARVVGKAYLSLLANRDFIGYVMLVGFAIAGFILLFAGAPFVFQKYLKMTPDQYGLWFMIACLGYPIGSIWSRRLLKKNMPLRRLGLLGVGLTALGNGVGALLTYYLGPVLYVAVSCNIVFSLGLGLCATVGRGGAMASIHTNIGFASWLMGFLMVVTGSVINALGSRLQLVENHHVALAMLGCSCLSFLALNMVRKNQS